MSYLKFRITLNKGKRGISLGKLETIVEELRKFFYAVGDDISLVEPDNWIGVDFKNGSLEFVTEYPHSVEMAKLARFNGAIITLARSEYPPSLRQSTSEHFFAVASLLNSGELADVAVFGEDDQPIIHEISNRTAALARLIDVLPFRESEGAVQGKIHSLYKESTPSHFMLRELSTDNLIKCIYKADDYPAIIQALKDKDQVLHVRGTVVTDTRERNIDHVTVKMILAADPYGFEDVEKFLGTGKPQ